MTTSNPTRDAEIAAVRRDIDCIEEGIKAAAASSGQSNPVVQAPGLNPFFWPEPECVKLATTMLFELWFFPFSQPRNRGQPWLN